MTLWYARASLFGLLARSLWSRPRRSLACAALVALTVCAPARARADEAAARAHFDRGISLYDAGRYEAALGEFRAAYDEKPSASIKQNIALCLKALNDPVAAATALDEALDEGGASLDPGRRAAIARELEGLARDVATLDVMAVQAGGAVVPGVTLSITPATGAPREVGAAEARRPIRLSPGVYTVRARAPGYAEPPEKKLALEGGAPVDVTFVFAERAEAPEQGSLTVRASVPDAAIRIDGAEVGHGTWSGALLAGRHELEVSAPGWKTTRTSITVPAGAALDYAVVLLAASELPPEYRAPALPRPPRPKKLYVVASGAVVGGGYRLSEALDEPPGGTRRPFVGGAFGLRGGYRVGKTFALELSTELGALGDRYKLSAGDDVPTRTTLTTWHLAPMARFATAGGVRFTAATGVGIQGVSIEAKVARPGSTVTRRGKGVGLAWLVDAGVALDVGPVFLEAALFAAIHGVESARASSGDARMLLASPAARGGARLGLGLPF